LNIILLLNINPLFTFILYEIFILIIPPTVSSRTYGEAGNRAYKANRGTDNRINNKIYKINKGTNNKINNKADKTVRIIKVNKKVAIISSGLSYIAAFYTTSVTASIAISINISSARGLSFSLTG